MSNPHVFGAIIIGGGQSGLATAYYLRRAGVDALILDDQAAPGGGAGSSMDCAGKMSPRLGLLGSLLCTLWSSLRVRILPSSLRHIWVPIH